MLKSDVVTTDAPRDKNSSYINSLREEIEYLREEIRTKTLIIKQLTEIKTMVKPTSTLVTCNGNSKGKTTQNSSNVIDKTIQNNNKEFLKKQKKIANKSLANTKILRTTDNFTSTCFEHPVNEKIASTNGNNTSEASEKEKQKKKKEDNCNEITNRNNNNNENRDNKNKTKVIFLVTA